MFDRENGRIERYRLFRKIQPALAKYGIKNMLIIDAIERSFHELEHSDDIQSWLLSLVFRKVFGGDGLPWIDSRTPTGNNVPLDVMAAAHAMWREAYQIALRQGLDELDAVEAMTVVVHATADRIADGRIAAIRNTYRYVFKGYLNALKPIAKRAGIVRYHNRNIKKILSDGGAVLAAIENAILRNEILKGMSPKWKKAAVFRYEMGYSCEETAAAMGLSNNAVRKALSVVLRKIFESYMLGQSGAVKD